MPRSRVRGASLAEAQRPDGRLGFVVGFLLGCCRGLLDELHLAIDTQDFHHLGLKVGIAAFQVVTDLVGLDLLLVEDVTQRALRRGSPCQECKEAPLRGQPPIGGLAK